MFISFDASQSRNRGETLRNPKRTKHGQRMGRRGPMVQACNSCRQRKIKCTGDKPCESCRWYRTPELCSYSQRQQSSSHSEKSGTPSNQYQAALERLFPDKPLDDIINLPRKALLELMNESGSQSSQHHDSPTTVASAHAHNSGLSMGQPVLETLHSIPDDGLDQGLRNSRDDSLEQISDDVNALSLSARQPASYLGISSMQAALKVITWLLPLSRLNGSTVLPQYQNNKNSNSTCSFNTQSIHMPSEGEMLDAYFNDLHSLAPLLDERSFRATHLDGDRTDSRWLALLNIVLALGSIAASGPDNQAHRTYFDRSMNLLNLATLGSPAIETVQTLGLIGGWYCHYISQPNLGYSLMGGALRMAVSLGLQREPYDSHLVLDPSRTAHREHKRRIWWSLCCLETWGHETLGRVSMDLFGPAITVAKPRLFDEADYLEILPLIENVEFIKISSKIQEGLASVPMITYSETIDLDSQLLQWWENLPTALKDYEPCPRRLYTARTVMQWRFNIQRMLLYRPKLLSYAMRRVPFMTLRTEERNAILKCREIAETVIESISTTTKLNQVVGWNAVWFLFQATMVPLLYLSIGARNDNLDDSFASCKIQVETAMMTLERIKVYRHTAERSLEAISSILEACLVSTGAGATPDTTAERIGLQNASQINGFEYEPPATQDRDLEWTMMSLENLPQQSIWEALSWGAQDMWLNVPGFGLENQESSIFETSMPLD